MSRSSARASLRAPPSTICWRAAGEVRARCFGGGRGTAKHGARHAAALRKCMPLFAGHDEIVALAIFELEVTAALTRRGLEPARVARFLARHLAQRTSVIIGPRAIRGAQRIVGLTRLRAADIHAKRLCPESVPDRRLPRVLMPAVDALANTAHSRVRVPGNRHAVLATRLLVRANAPARRRHHRRSSVALRVELSSLAQAVTCNLLASSSPLASTG
jgi:hypothetical protein